MMAAAFDWHNYGKSTIGNRSDIERVPIENLQAFYTKLLPARQRRADRRRQVRRGQGPGARRSKYFGAIPRPDAEARTRPTPKSRRRTASARSSCAASATWRSSARSTTSRPASHEDYRRRSTCSSSILSTPPSGRLYKALVETKKATSVSAGADSAARSGRVRRHRRGRQGAVARRSSRHHAGDAGRSRSPSGVTEEEVERAKRSFLNNRRAGAARTPARSPSACQQLGRQGDWRLYFLHRDRIEKVTPADVQRVAAKYLVASNRTLGYFIPVRQRRSWSTVPATPDVPGPGQRLQGPAAGRRGRRVRLQLSPTSRPRRSARNAAQRHQGRRCSPSRRATKSSTCS